MSPKMMAEFQEALKSLTDRQSRILLAAAALQGLLASNPHWESADTADTVRDAVALADAVMERLERAPQ